MKKKYIAPFFKKIKLLVINYKLLLLLLLFWKLTDLSVSIFARYFIPYLGFFPYKEVLEKTRMPQFMYSFANFDGTHYLLIAKNGYYNYTQAFFPFYPLAIRFLTFLKLNSLIGGLLISNISFLAGIFLFYKLFKDKGKECFFWTILFLLFFPTSFFFGAVYTEGLFFFLFISSLYFLKKEKYFWAGIFAFFASLTKLIGIFLIIPLFISLVLRIKKSYENKKTLKGSQITLFSPLLGFFLYAFYLWKTTGDPLYFLSSQPAFGAHRSTNLIFIPQVYYRYFKILTTASHNFQYFISLLEVSVFTFFLIVLLFDLKKNYRNRFRLGLNLFSLSNLILPTLTGTFSSVPRYVLLSISVFIYLGEWKNRLGKIIVLGVFGLLHILLLGLFIQGYFVG